MLDRTFASEPSAGEHLVPGDAFFDAVDAHHLDDPYGDAVPDDEPLADTDEHVAGHDVSASQPDEHYPAHDVHDPSHDPSHDLGDEHPFHDPFDLDHHEGGSW